MAFVEQARGKGRGALKYFLNLLFLRIKASLRSFSFWALAALFVALPMALTYLLPQQGQSGMNVGIFPIDSVGESAAQLLEKNEDYKMVRYGGVEDMRRDVVTGELHCAFVLGGDDGVSCYQTDASYMSPLLARIVGAAYFEAETPGIVSDFLSDNSISASGLSQALERARQTSNPLTVEIESVADAPEFESMTQNSMQPLCYAVLVCAFFYISALPLLLRENGADMAQKYLARLSGRKAASVAAPIIAHTLLNAAMLLAADFILNSCEANPLYTLSARLTMVAVVAALAAAFGMGARLLRRWRVALIALIPPLLIIGVICSGGLLDTNMLPPGLRELRFLSPAWYALQILS